MATQFYVEQADRAPSSGIADEDVKAGVLVHDDGAGVRRLEFADSDYAGLAIYDPEVLAAEDHDVNTTAADFTYSSDDRVKYQPSEDAAVVKIRTIDGHADDSAVSIGHRDVVGILDETNVDLNGSAVNYEGRIVEEGYTETTTFNRGNTNFKAVGRALRPAKQNGNSVTADDEPVRVALFESLRS